MDKVIEYRISNNMEKVMEIIQTISDRYHKQYGLNLVLVEERPYHNVDTALDIYVDVPAQWRRSYYGNPRWAQHPAEDVTAQKVVVRYQEDVISELCKRLEYPTETCPDVSVMASIQTDRQWMMLTGTTRRPEEYR